MRLSFAVFCCGIHDSKAHGANMGPIWGRQDPGEPHVSPMNFAILDVTDQLLAHVLWCDVIAVETIIRLPGKYMVVQMTL